MESGEEDFDVEELELEMISAAHQPHTRGGSIKQANSTYGGGQLPEPAVYRPTPGQRARAQLAVASSTSEYSTQPPPRFDANPGGSYGGVRAGPLVPHAPSPPPRFRRDTQVRKYDVCKPPEKSKESCML